MKRSVAHTMLVLVFALCSIGAKKCTPKSGESLPSSNKPFCYTDPPIGCAAYCQNVDTIAFTPACSDVSAGDKELLFELTVMNRATEEQLNGNQVCPQAELSFFLTPCHLDIIPQEWPNQDYEYCQPVPPGCPL
ncbi:uncharacterized protein SOCE26_064440 [Sorangium cellulosum]|uniref:Secreted protein n=1 Tax=Sorangium cellulosum TaxID=56 RepID=A0A2L0F085_SORCE|nr:hypothetical protein [Sorangium cellulosum]AUX44974.1 uncharacterized protein SOCE26_064440 [Sorangium cellulosum]